MPIGIQIIRPLWVARRLGTSEFANARFDEVDPFNVDPDEEFEAVRVEINQ